MSQQTSTTIAPHIKTDGSHTGQYLIQIYSPGHQTAILTPNATSDEQLATQTQRARDIHQGTMPPQTPQSADTSQKRAPQTQQTAKTRKAKDQS